MHLIYYEEKKYSKKGGETKLMSRRLLSVLLAVTLVFSNFMPVFASSTSELEGHWAKEEIDQWLADGMINGYEDGLVKPNKSITRAEFIALVNRSFKFTGKSESIEFSDVKSSDWFYNDILIAQKAGYINGYEDGTIRPGNQITREEVAVIIARLLELESVLNKDVLTDFKDQNHISKWSQGAVSALVEEEIINGYPDNSFQPKRSITRAEAIVTMDRALNSNVVLYNLAGVYGPTKGVDTVEGNVIVNVEGVTLQNMVINGNLVLAEGIGEGEVYLKNVTVNGDTFIKGGGENSIYLEDSVLVTVIVDKRTGEIRIVAQGSTSVQQLTLQSGARIEESGVTGDGFRNVTISEEVPENAQVSLAGTFETVDVIAVSVAVEIPRGQIERLNVNENSANSTINLGQQARIVALTLNAVARVLGEGRIDTAQINAPGSEFERSPRTIALAAGISAIINGRETTSSSPSGGSSGGLSGGSSSDNAPNVYTIDSIIATDDTIYVYFEEQSVTQATYDDFEVTAMVDNESYQLQNLSYDSQLNKFTFDPIPFELDGQSILYTVSAKEDSNTVTGTALTNVHGFEGYITDVNEQGVSGMTIKFRSGLGNQTGQVVASAVTDENGYYSIALSQGIYTGELQKEGYITTYLVAVSLSVSYNREQNATAILVPEEGEIRIVLTWGEHPVDLDSHLIGPTPYEYRFHTAYYQQGYYDYETDTLYADLDWDDVTSYGPETTTIYQQLDGTYRFVVHHFFGQQTLRTSNAKVEVYNGETLMQTFHVPTGEGEEIYWVVFEMEGNTITPIDLLTSDRNIALDNVDQDLMQLYVDQAIAAIDALPTIDLLLLEDIFAVDDARYLVDRAFYNGASQSDITNLSIFTAAETKMIQLIEENDLEIISVDFTSDNNFSLTFNRDLTNIELDLLTLLDIAYYEIGFYSKSSEPGSRDTVLFEVNPQYGQLGYIIGLGSRYYGKILDEISSINNPPVNADGYPFANNIQDHSFDIRVKYDEDATVYYVMYAQDGSRTDPSVSDVVYGTDGDGSQSNMTWGNYGTIIGGEEDFLTFAGYIDAATTYDVFIVAEDESGNRQADVTKLSVATLEETYSEPTVTLDVYSVYISLDGTVTNAVYGPYTNQSNNFVIPANEDGPYLVFQFSDSAESDALDGTIDFTNIIILVDDSVPSAVYSDGVYLGIDSVLDSGSHTIVIDGLTKTASSEVYNVDTVTIQVYKE